MAFGWLSRLVKQEHTASGDSHAHVAVDVAMADVSEPASGTGESATHADGIAPIPFIDAADLAPPAAAAPEAPPPTPVDQLIAQLAARHVAHQDTSASPDASAVLDLLSGSADTIIRQLPAAARASLALCDDPSITRRQFAEKLASDPALVQGMLRTANSAAFGAGKEPVISIEPALDRIGIGGARAIIFANAVDGTLSRPGGEFNGMAADVWNHMVRTAPIARALAPLFGVDPDEAFSIALLHDVGKLVIFDRISVLRASKRRDVQLTADFVHDLLDSLHEPLGASALLAWGMGERSARAIGAHHRRTNDGEPNPLAEVVFVAELSDHAARRGIPLDLQRVWFDAHITVDFARLVPVLHGFSVPFVY